jgi:hypothetical protein
MELALEFVAQTAYSYWWRCSANRCSNPTERIMRNILLKLSSLGVLVFALGALTPVLADLIYDVQVDDLGQGFGTRPTILTFQNDGTEQGCVKWDGSNNAYGSPCPEGITAGSTIEGKSTTLTIAELAAVDIGIDSAGELGIIFNPAEPGGATNAITLDELVLTFYNSSGTVLASYVWNQGPMTFCCDNNGTGGAGQVFKLDYEQAQLASAWFSDTTNRIGLAAVITSASGSAESFYPFEVTPAPVPEPSSFVMLGAGLIALGLLFRKRTKRS